MNRKLLSLLARNAKKGQFRAEGNVIYLYDVIVASDADAEWFGGVSAEAFVKTLSGLKGDVELRINSPGGDVFGAKAMAQAVREHGGKVTARVDGYAASAATFLTSVADETIMAPGSMLMIHKAWTIALGNTDEFTAVAGLLEKIDGTIAQGYAAAAAKRGVDAPDFAELMAKESWFTAAEAIAAGLADGESDEEPKAGVEWDLSAYEHAPAPRAADTKAVYDPRLGAVAGGVGAILQRTESGPLFDIGDRVQVVGPPHMEGQAGGEVREAVLTYAYGVLFDGMEADGIHHWYVESELAAANTEAAKMNEIEAARRRMNAGLRLKPAA